MRRNRIDDLMTFIQAQKQLQIDRHIHWLLKDDFNDTVAAGAVNGTLATPIGGTRTVTDVNSKLSIGSGLANFATGGAGTGDPGIWYPVITRVAGRLCVAKVSGTNTNYSAGWDSATSGNPAHGINITTSNNLRVFFNNGSPLVVGTDPASGATVYVASILRATGAFLLIKETTAFSNWTLLYPDALNSQSSMYPTISAAGATAVFTGDFVRVPQNLIYIVPLASDAFTRANGAPGVTGGGGSGEGGGTGLTWTDQKGVSAIASNMLTFTSLTTSLGIATVPCGTPNVMVEAICTRAAGNSGLVLRWTDANNYIAAYLDGTNLIVVEVVAGTPNTLQTTAVTYGATKRLVISLNATKIRAYYGDALVGAEL